MSFYKAEISWQSKFCQAVLAKDIRIIGFVKKQRSCYVIYYWWEVLLRVLYEFYQEFLLYTEN